MRLLSVRFSQAHDGHFRRRSEDKHFARVVGRLIRFSDEVAALVFDVGSMWVRVGYAGEDVPKVVIPSAVGFISDGDVVMMDADKPHSSPRSGKWFVGDNEINLFRPKMEILRPLKDGLSLYCSRRRLFFGLLCF